MSKSNQINIQKKNKLYENIDFTLFRDNSIRNSLKGEPYTFKSFLPFTIHLFVRKPAKVFVNPPVDVQTDLIAIIKPFKEIIVSTSERGLPLEKGDTIRVLFYDIAQQSFYEVIRPFFLRDDTRHIDVGTVGYKYRQKNAQNMNNDITGILFHNQIAIPVNIFMDDKGEQLHLGYASKDDGTDRASGSKNNVYIDNDNKGFRVGQKIKIELIKFGQYLEFQINDNFITDVYIGINQQKESGPLIDRFAYRLGKSGPFPNGESDLSKYPYNGFAFYKMKSNEIIPQINSMVAGDGFNKGEQPNSKHRDYQTIRYKNPLEVQNSFP